MCCYILFIKLLLLTSITAVMVPNAIGIPADSDTVYLLGGPDRWDGRFETATGQPDWQGWTHADLYEQGELLWQVSDFQAENLGGHGPGNLAAWCGTTFDNECGPGYGDSWHSRLIWSGSVPDPAAATEVRITARLNVDTEPAYDFVYLEAWQGGQWTTLATWDGVASDVAVDVSLSLTPDDYIGAAGDEVWLNWRVTSDGGWSDEDCLYDTNGACQIDDVTVLLNDTQVFYDDFQDGDLSGWDEQYGGQVGDFSQLWSGLDDLDPDQVNTSWQVTFIDDGVVVPGTGGTQCVSWCYGPDGWVFNVTGGLSGFGVPGGPFPQYISGVWNGVISPPLAWPPTVDAGRFAFDVYAHMQTYACGFTTYGWTVRATTSDSADDLKEVPWEPTRWSLFNPESMPEGPGYFRVEAPLGATFPPGVQWIQVRLEVVVVGPYCWGPYVTEGTPAPYFDNVAVSAWSTVTDVPRKPHLLALKAQPNPFNPRVTITYSLPRAGDLELVLYDVTGRRVQTLYHGPAPAGRGWQQWDGSDATGQKVAAGVYFVRLVCGRQVLTRPVTLLK
jgi:hypothetical protein